MKKSILIALVTLCVAMTTAGCEKQEQLKLLRKKWKLEKHFSDGSGKDDGKVKNYVLDMSGSSYSLSCRYNFWGSFQNVSESGTFGYPDRSRTTISFTNGISATAPLHAVVTVLTLDEGHFNFRVSGAKEEYHLVPF